MGGTSFDFDHMYIYMYKPKYCEIINFGGANFNNFYSFTGLKKELHFVVLLAWLMNKYRVS